MCLKNKTFLRATQKYFSSFNYWKYVINARVYHWLFISFSMTDLVYLLQKTTSSFLLYVFTTVKLNLFLFFLLPKHVKSHSKFIYEGKPVSKNFKILNKFLNILKWILNLMLVVTVYFYSLAQFTRLNIFKVLTTKSTSKHVSLDPLFLCLFFFLVVFLCILKEWTWKEVEIPFNVFFVFYSVIPLCTISRKNT